MTTPTTDWKEHLTHLLDAELQFRLIAAVQIAVTCRRQPLDFPEVWTYGHVTVRYEELVLRQEQAEDAARLLEHSATLTMAVVVKDAIEAVVPELIKSVRREDSGIMQAVDDAIAKSTSQPWKVATNQVATAYHISRLIRNAYAHAPFAPKWKIRSPINNTTLIIPNVIELDTRGLDGNTLEWQHYGGPLALYRFCRFTRFAVLGDEPHVSTNIPSRQRKLTRLGDASIEQINTIPEGYVRAAIETNADGSIDLGHGYQIRTRRGESPEE